MEDLTDIFMKIELQQLWNDKKAEDLANIISYELDLSKKKTKRLKELLKKYL